MIVGKFKTFLTIVEKGSLVAAAREMGMSPTSVSEHLAALEAHCWCCALKPYNPLH